jgi:hypothetical protein
MADLALFLKAICSREAEIETIRLHIAKLDHLDIIDIFNMINFSKGLGLLKSDVQQFL